MHVIVSPPPTRLSSVSTGWQESHAAAILSDQLIAASDHGQQWQTG